MTGSSALYKLINPGGSLHNYASRMYWGHNIDGSDDGTPITFTSLCTLQYRWSVFSQRYMQKGDFIIRRDSTHTKVLLYELVEVERCGDPSDMYNVTANLCGYYTGGVMQIADGYGILPSKVSWFKRLFKKETK